MSDHVDSEILDPTLAARTICCLNPDLRRAWMPRKPFGRAWYCYACGHLTDDMSGFERWLFEHIVAPFWNGQVQIIDPAPERS